MGVFYVYVVKERRRRCSKGDWEEVIRKIGKDQNCITSLNKKRRILKQKRWSRGVVKYSREVKEFGYKKKTVDLTTGGILMIFEEANISSMVETKANFQGDKNRGSGVDQSLAN